MGAARNLGHLGLAAAVALLAGAVGCSVLGGDDYPDRTCSDDNDCFTAQGESCDPERKVCIEGDGGAGLVDVDVDGDGDGDGDGDVADRFSRARP